ncbi:MAG: hypothetical protein AB7H66_07235 [Hyphomonadaceae bacterium]
MTQDFQQRSWVAVVRGAFRSLLRPRCYAVLQTPGAKSKLEPIAKVLADIRNEPAASVD